MEKKKHKIIALIFYILGTLAALYVGTFLMLIKPIYLLITGFFAHTLRAGFVLKMVLRIFLSSTVFGFVWCIGYVFFNRFMGTEDPNWDELNPKSILDEFEDVSFDEASTLTEFSEQNQ